MRRVAGILFAVVFFQMTAMALVFQDDDCVPGQQNREPITGFRADILHVPR